MHQGQRSNNIPKTMALSTFFAVLVISALLIGQESEYINNIQDQNSVMTADAVDQSTVHASLPQTSQQYYDEQYQIHNANPFALAPGELPGYTGWARPEQTLAGYFDTSPLSHQSTKSLQSKYYSTVKSGDKFSILLTCNHNHTIRTAYTEQGEEEEEEPPYICPEDGGTLFYVRAYGPAVLTGLVTDFHNSSYSVEMQFIDPGEYTLEVVVTFSVPLDYDEFPLDGNDIDDGSITEPGYEGYMVYGFPLSILVVDDPDVDQVNAVINGKKDKKKKKKPWCTLSQLTESDPQSALYKGHWQVIDAVARSAHQPITPDETLVSLDGYRMGLNSVGVRMSFEYEDCELLHIRDLTAGIRGSGMDKCLLHDQLGFNIHIPEEVKASENITESGGNNTTTNNINTTANHTLALESGQFEGVHVIFIGDSVIRLERFFFLKLVRGSFGMKVTMVSREKHTLLL